MVHGINDYIWILWNQSTSLTIFIFTSTPQFPIPPWHYNQQAYCHKHWLYYGHAQEHVHTSQGDAKQISPHPNDVGPLIHAQKTRVNFCINVTHTGWWHHEMNMGSQHPSKWIVHDGPQPPCYS